MEHIQTPKVENVKLLNKFSPKASPVGTLYLTTTHLIFVSTFPDDKKELWILHMQIHTVEKPMLTTSGTQIKIICSNFQSATFIVQKDRDAHAVFSSLNALSKPKDIQELYCFSYNPKGEVRQTTGWFFHDLTAEFQRQGVPNGFWAACNLNSDYSLCPTYSRTLFVPSRASRAILEGSARFRSRGRLPVLTYLHAKNSAAIVRCAQPLVGIGGARNAWDEQYVELLRSCTPAADFIHVIDTRPAINAMANKAGGKGYENERFYENIRFQFKGIENIHAMRKSLKAMTTAVATATTMEGFLTDLGNSGWLKHIKTVLDTSLFISSAILSGQSVMVHCSDGWDRTSQTCALAQLICDGYYRTIQGFQALIEKDWLSSGYRFQDRCGHLSDDPDQVSPVFSQFLEATWQLTQIYPQSFQFNERYLIALHEHAYSCQYGTFLGNCERERHDLRLSERTYSLWGYLVSHVDEYTNPLYDDGAADPNAALRVDAAASSAATGAPPTQPAAIPPQSVRFWSGLYCRHDEGALPREPEIDLLAIQANQTSSLEDHTRQLSGTITTMKQLISTAKSSGAAKAMQARVLPSPGSAAAVMMRSPGKSPAASTSADADAHAPPTPAEGGADRCSDMDKMERKFTDLKTSIVEKCQSSKM